MTDVKSEEEQNMGEGRTEQENLRCSARPPQLFFALPTSLRDLLQLAFGT